MSTSVDVLHSLVGRADAKLLDVKSTQPLAGLFHSAADLFNEGISESNGGDIERAYVFLLRYVTFAISRLPKHRQYNHAQFVDMKNECRASSARAMQVLEELKQKIVIKYDGAPSQPSTPPPLAATGGSRPSPSAPAWNE